MLEVTLQTTLLHLAQCLLHEEDAGLAKDFLAKGVVYLCQAKLPEVLRSNLVLVSITQ